MVWRVKLVAELELGLTTEVEIARLERDDRPAWPTSGSGLPRQSSSTAALQAEMVPAQVTMVGERRRSCVACRSVLASKGHYTARCRSQFGGVPLRVRRLLTCSCQGSGKAKSFALLDSYVATVAPELAYVTARYAALAPFGKVAARGPNCFRSAEHRTRARCGTGRCGSARTLCSRTPPRRQSRPRRRGSMQICGVHYAANADASSPFAGRKPG